MKFKDYFKIFTERAYHGSTAPIENEFDYEKIGKASGTAFGWGFYFAEDPQVADQYVRGGWKQTYQYKKKSALWWYDYYVNKGDYIKASIWENIMLHKSKNAILNSFDDDETDAELEAKKYINSLPDSLFAPPEGKLYHVELNVEDHELLEWNKIFTEQSEFIQNKLLPFKSNIEMGMNYVTGNNKLETSEGHKIYSGIAEAFSIPYENGGLQYSPYDKKYYPSQKSASLFLLSLGIKGNVYSDMKSSEAHALGQEHTRTRNIVIFDPKDIEILNR